MHENRFATHSLQDPRLLRILSAAITAVDPATAVKKYLPKLHGNIYGLGIGKASIPMLTALAECYPLSNALAISKHASDSQPNLFPVILAGHPLPNADSLRAGERALQFVSSLTKEDTLVCLISGGGSALMSSSLIPLADLQALTTALLKSGATINEINTIRRHLDRVKGGGLARATQAKIVSLILSDVIGNPLEVIASGPTAPDPTTKEDALTILEKYSLGTPKLRSLIFSHETLKPNDPTFTRLQNIIIGDNKLAARAAQKQAQLEGFSAEIITNELQGEAREVGIALAKGLREECAKRAHPFCLIAGGETTVTIKGDGKGGRNQELALAAVNELRGVPHAMLIALATDGDDGPTNAAGAVVTGDSAQVAELLGLDVAGSLSRNDAYHVFERLGDLLLPGPTGTNVNDLVFLIGL